MSILEQTAVHEAGGPDAPERGRPSKLYLWGVAIAHHRRAVLVSWAVVLTACAILYPSLQRSVNPPYYGVENGESARAERLLEQHFPNLGSEDDALVFSSSRHIASDPTFHAVVAAVVKAARRQEGVKNVLSPFDNSAIGQISSDEHVAIAEAALSGSAGARFGRADRLQQAATRAAGAGVQVWLTGYSPITRDLSQVTKEDTKKASVIGLSLALVILLVALGAVVAAAMPLLLAVAGLFLAYGVLAVLIRLFAFDTLLVSFMTLIGLGIGIDYALFIVSRFRGGGSRREGEEHGSLHDRGGSAEEHGDVHDRGGSAEDRIAHAVGTAISTSGRTVLLSGVIVALSLASLAVVDVPFFHEFAAAAVIVVICTLIAALTLLPAMLALLGPRIEQGALPRRLRSADLGSGVDQADGRWARWATRVMRHPLLAAGAAALVLLVAAVPALGLRYGMDVNVRSLSGTPSGKGDEALTRSFSPGVLAPLQVIVVKDGADPHGSAIAGAKTLTDELERDPRVTGTLERRAPSGDGVLLTVVPSVAVDSPTAHALVEHIRNDLVPRIRRASGATALTGGITALQVDFSHEARAKLPLMLLLILGISLICLVVAFRSLVLPLKAVLLNLLAVSATIGLVVFVFQDGHGEQLLGFTSAGFIQAYLPLIVFALLFGLSTDYEVFLIRRIQEEWRRTGDNQLAVAAGVQHTARMISAAAAIMVVVFGSFVTAGLAELKELGFALAVAIAIDATLVRFVLVPALMRLFGAWNWWLPATLARMLPNVGGDDRAPALTPPATARSASRQRRACLRVYPAKRRTPAAAPSAPVPPPGPVRRARAAAPRLRACCPSARAVRCRPARLPA